MCAGLYGHPVYCISSKPGLHNIQRGGPKTISCGPRELSQLQKMLQKLDLK